MLGCVADDFTGATDVAAAFVAAGFRTEVLTDLDAAEAVLARSGAPGSGASGPGTSSADALSAGASGQDASGPEPDAVVVALKTRTAPVESAVEQSLRAVRVLARLGATWWFVKYCSTFDSTPTGNIGPVVDAVLREVDAPLAIVAPSFPANGRRVFQRTLFVHGEPLAESPMRNHPLTPMRDSDLVRLLAPQTVRPVAAVPLERVRDRAALAADLAALAEAGERPSVVVDAIDDDDLVRIAEAAPPGALLTGAAGLAAALRGPHGASEAAVVTAPEGRPLVLAGSASEATRAQVHTASGELEPVRLEPDAAAADPDAETARLLAAVMAAWEAGRTPLVYATGAADDLVDAAADVRATAGAAIEHVLGALAVAAVRVGARRIIVAGGETSGEVTRALGVARLEIGPTIAPGVVWSVADTASGARIALALKSGNFGGPRLFLDAWELLP